MIAGPELDIAIGIAAVSDVRDLDVIAEVAEENSVIRRAEALQGRGLAFQALEVR